MKKYNVTLSNDQCIFDSREDIETVEEAVSFATGRGSSYMVYVASGDATPIKAVYHTDKKCFEVEDGMDYWIFMTPANFAKYIRKYL